MRLLRGEFSLPLERILGMMNIISKSGDEYFVRFGAT